MIRYFNFVDCIQEEETENQHLQIQEHCLEPERGHDLSRSQQGPNGEA